MGGTSFEIATRARRLANALMDITDDNGEVNEQAYDAWLAELEATSADINTKLQSLRAVRSRLLAESEALKMEATRISTMSKRRVGYMKNLLMAHQETNPGTTRIDCEDGHVRLDRRTSIKVELGEFWEPTSYLSEFMIDQPPKLDKAGIKAAIKNGTHTIKELGRAGVIVTLSDDLVVVEGK